MRGKNLKLVKWNEKTEKIFNKLIWCLTVVLYVSIGLFDNHTLASLLFYGITGCIGCLILLKELMSFRPKIQSYHVIVMIFIMFCYASSLWGWDTGYPVSTAGYILRMFICSSVLYYYFEKQESVEPLLQALKWGGYILAYSCLIGYGLQNVFDILLNGGRLYNDFVCHIGSEQIHGLFYGIFVPNINFLGLYVAIPMVVGFFDIAYLRKNTFLEVCYILPVMLFIIISGGKMNFIILAISTFIIILLKTKGDNIKVTIIRWGIVVIVTVMALYVLSFFPMFKETFSRFYAMVANLLGKSYEVSTNERVTMFEVGIEQVLKTPLGGIGIDNARFLLEKETGIHTYLHCNYIELLTGVGIVGTALFYMCYCYPLLFLFKYRKVADEHTIICVLLMLVSFVAEIAIVTYTLRTTYLLFALYFIHARRLKENIIQVRKNINDDESKR